MNFHSL